MSIRTLTSYEVAPHLHILTVEVSHLGEDADIRYEVVCDLCDDLWHFATMHEAEAEAADHFDPSPEGHGE
jgi:hypothetical protein